MGGLGYHSSANYIVRRLGCDDLHPQRLARDEEEDDDGNEETGNEIQDLADDADIPIEQLLARYGYLQSDTKDADEGMGASEGSSAEEADAEPSGAARPSAAVGGSPDAAENRVAGEGCLEDLMDEEPDAAGEPFSSRFRWVCERSHRCRLMSHKS